MSGLQSFRLGLRQKVVVVVVATYVLLAVSFVFPTIWFHHSLVERELVGSGKLLATHVVTMSRYLIREGDLEALRLFVQDFRRGAPGWVAYVAVVAADGRVAASTGPGDLVRAAVNAPVADGAGQAGEVRELGGRSQLWRHLFGHTFDISLPLAAEGAPRGWVRVGISTASANREMRQVTLASMGIAGGAILLGVFVGWAVDRRIRASLSRLIEVTGRMARGDLSLRVDIRTGDELEELGGAFNRMADDLARYHTGLEDEVLARTRELAEVNDALKRIQTEQIRYERLAVLGEMTAVVSHEVRTPLNAMSIHVQRLRRKLRAAGGDEDRQQAEIVNLLAFEIDRIQKVLAEYMRFARPQPVSGQSGELNAIVRSVVHLLDLEARRARVQIHFQPGPDPPPVAVEQDKLRQVFLNLLLNSIQAMPGGGRITVETGRAEGDAVRARVADTGPGIPPEIRDRIFQPFFTTKPGGTGLGLAIVARIVREAGGSISCRSDCEQGAEFELVLPVSPAAPAPPEGPHDAVGERRR
jgi:signal transduction histidine kinase